MALLTCSFLVSGFLTEIVQQIHSLRESGVMSSHAARAARSEARAVRRSAGSLCATPSEIFLLISDYSLSQKSAAILAIFGKPIALINDQAFSIGEEKRVDCHNHENQS
jgi:hypothetical protein